MRNVCNIAIREAAKAAGVKHWEVAECYGLSEDRFCRLLRHELPAEEQERILAIIAKLSADRRE